MIVLSKFMKRAALVLIGLVVGAGLALGILCLSGQDAADKLLFGCCGDEAAAQENPQSEALLLAYDAAETLRDGDFEALAELVHPKLGLVVTPFSTVNLSSDRWFTAEETAALGRDTKSYIWGVDPVTGNVIELPAAEFFAKYIYDHEYASASVAGINTVVQQGNALENVASVFPDAVFVDLHEPGQDGNWSTLRFVFEESEGDLRLVALIHSAYTV